MSTVMRTHGEYQARVSTFPGRAQGSRPSIRTSTAERARPWEVLGALALSAVLSGLFGYAGHLALASWKLSLFV